MSHLPEPETPAVTIETPSSFSARRRAALMCLIEFVGSFIVTINYRGISAMNYWAVGITDAILSIMVFISIKLIMEATTWTERTAYVLGSVAGAQAAMYWTRAWP